MKVLRYPRVVLRRGRLSPVAVGFATLNLAVGASSASATPVCVYDPTTGNQVGCINVPIDQIQQKLSQVGPCALNRPTCPYDDRYATCIFNPISGQAIACTKAGAPFGVQGASCPRGIDPNRALDYVNKVKNCI
jgi:hypothetical protein